MMQIQDEATLETFCQLLAQAFAVPASKWKIWAERIGHDNLRLLEHGGEIVTGLGFYPFGHYFGGKEVSAAGFAGVGSAPHHRGRGFAKKLLLETMHECREKGFATTTLFAADWPIYRSCGFELAGSFSQFRADINMFTLSPLLRGMDLKPFSPLQYENIEDLYARHAQQRNGWLKRNDAIWRRTVTTMQDDVEVENKGYLLPDGAGYFIYSQSRDAESPNLHIEDYVFETEAAVQQFFTFLAYHSSIFKQVYWKGCLRGGFILNNARRHFENKVTEHWMLRLLDVQRALSERGYPPVLETDIVFSVEDNLIPANSGSYRLSVDKGHAEVVRTKATGVTTDVQTLSTLFTGFMSPFEAQRQGRLNGSHQDCYKIAALFGGEAPWCPDYF